MSEENINVDYSFYIFPSIDFVDYELHFFISKKDKNKYELILTDKEYREITRGEYVKGTREIKLKYCTVEIGSNCIWINSQKLNISAYARIDEDFWKAVDAFWW